MTSEKKSFYFQIGEKTVVFKDSYDKED